ncbi:MAG TPA: hypothetical protein VMF09_11560 [Solirubrobacteraceae bacterium]|nr:hypothetical protein [Solirubrobacteraceae bacterium]
MRNDTTTPAAESTAAADPTPAEPTSETASTETARASNEPEQASSGAVRGRKGAKASKPQTAKSTRPAATKAAASNGDRKASVTGSQRSSKPAATAGDGMGKLRPGELDGLVLKFLKDNASSGPHGPSSVAQGLQRSSGAVANCLARLKTAKQVRQVGDKPRRYKIAA